jgi:hypothetical protein
MLSEIALDMEIFLREPRRGVSLLALPGGVARNIKK